MAAFPSLTRRTLLGAAAGAALAPAAFAAPSAAPAWNRAAFQEAMRKAGRPIDLTD